MRKLLVLSSLILAATFRDALGSDSPDSPPRVLQDPKTKVVYYLESDQCHIAAISPDGKLLWCLQVMPSNYKERGFKLQGFGFWHPGNFQPMDGSKGEDCIVVFSWVGTMMTTVINKKTGVVAGAIGE
jgi:hypothetical protein